MADNFDFKKFLMENKLGAYSKAGLINEGGSSTAHMMARQAMQNGMSPEEAAEELEISGIDPIKAKAIVNDVYGEDLSSDLEMGDDDDFGLFQEADDVIYGRGDDDDYDRKRDAQSSGARFIPISDPSNPYHRSERSSSKWGSYKKPYKQQGVSKHQQIYDNVKLERIAKQYGLFSFLYTLLSSDKIKDGGHFVNAINATLKKKGKELSPNDKRDLADLYNRRKPGGGASGASSSTSTTV